MTSPLRLDSSGRAGTSGFRTRKHRQNPRVHRECVTTALIGFGRLSVGLVEKYAGVLAEFADRCLCPRCGAGPVAEWASTSRVTGDRCVRICDRCAGDETSRELRTGVVPPIVTWPTLARR